MTEEELATIEARCTAAMPGPWHIERYQSGWAIEVESQREPPERGWLGEFGLASREEADFAAHARTDLPRAVAEVRRLRAALELVRRLNRVVVLGDLSPTDHAHSDIRNQIRIVVGEALNPAPQQQPVEETRDAV